MTAPLINPADWPAFEMFDEVATAIEAAKESAAHALFMAARLARATVGDPIDAVLAVSAVHENLRLHLDVASVAATVVGASEINAFKDEESW